MSRSARVRRVIGEMLAKQGMELIPWANAEDALYLEAAGCAWVAAETGIKPPPLENLLAPPPEVRLARTRQRRWRM